MLKVSWMFNVERCTIFLSCLRKGHANLRDIIQTLLYVPLERVQLHAPYSLYIYILKQL